MHSFAGMTDHKHIGALKGWSVALLYVLALLLVIQTAGQGFARDSNIVGASDATSRLQQLYSNSRNWQRKYQLSPSAACSRRGSLCAAADSSSLDSYAQLMLATSPRTYSSLDSRYTGGLKLVASPQNQKPCSTCSAFAVASAAETAMASALGVDVSQCSISVQALHFCPPDGQASRSCSSGYTLSSTLNILNRYHKQLPTDACLSYRPSLIGNPRQSGLCNGKCNNANQHAKQGSFDFIQISTAWEAQLYIRQYGSVLTQFDVMDGFKEFYDNPANVKAVYKPKPGATLAQSHAVVLVGYDNDQQYWLAKNSWGDKWADGGFFRVAYDTCSVLSNGGEAYAVTWQPVALKLPLSPGPRAGCYWYQARAGDYMSKIAWLTMSLDNLDKFMLDNVGNVKDLDAPLQGKQLLVCNPSKGTYVLPGSPSSATSSPGGAAADPQLEALLRIKTAIDTTNVLKEWTREAGRNGGYCHGWRGIYCNGKVVATLELIQNVFVNGLIGTLPPAVALVGLPGLTWIDISDQPGITGTIPSDWAKLGQLETIHLSGNSLTGTIPAAWSSLTRLKDLTLGYNKLTGQLPDSFKELRSLVSLFVYINKLSGTIPAWLGTNLGQLNYLSLGLNAFSGTIPASLGNLKQLKVLDLAENQLTGPLPASFSNLRALKNLNVESNAALTGTIPASWASMTALTTVNLSDNLQLGGCLPATWKGTLKDKDIRVTRISGFC